jgi:hypothetical protein
MFIPRSIASAIDKIARQTVGKDWSLYANLLDHWIEIVGPEYAAVSTPVKVTFPHQPHEPRRRGGTLTIKLPKGLVMEFTFKVDSIKQRINNYFGDEIIARIVFEPTHGVPKVKATPTVLDAAVAGELQQKTAGVEQDDLRNALQSFGEAVVTSKPTPY